MAAMAVRDTPVTRPVLNSDGPTHPDHWQECCDSGPTRGSSRVAAPSMLEAGGGYAAAGTPSRERVREDLMSHTSALARSGGTTRRTWRVLRDFFAIQVELHERAALRNTPWEEDLLHWAGDGTALHGWLVPPAGQRRSTTRSGWCPGLAVRRRQSF
jgi:hypothetical protein